MLGSTTRKLFQKFFTLAVLIGALAFVSAPSKASMTAACGDCSASYTTCTQSNAGGLDGLTACKDALSSCASSCTPAGEDASSKCADKSHACGAVAEADYDVCRETCAGDSDCISICGENRAKSHTSCRTAQDACSASASN